ncbi:MAG: DUF1932 domain-containing protein [Actinomycetota bacterium]
MTHPVIGLIHPGEMGAAVARLLRDSGHQVLWASSDRGPQTRRRAEDAGLLDVGTIGALVEHADVVFSICPPHAALDVARSVAGYAVTFVDANAVSPETAREIAEPIDAGGGRCIDGGIVGPPPLRAGDTRLYLSGRHAGIVRDLFARTVVDARVVDDRVGSASALKMCYAAWTKGTAALLLAIRTLARAEGVETPLLDEWAISQPDLTGRSSRAAGSAGTKGWRWVAEMEHIAATFASLDLPPGFHESAAAVFDRVPRQDRAGDGVEALDRVVSALLAGVRSGTGASRPGDGRGSGPSG